MEIQHGDPGKRPGDPGDPNDRKLLGCPLLVSERQKKGDREREREREQEIEFVDVSEHTLHTMLGLLGVCGGGGHVSVMSHRPLSPCALRRFQVDASAFRLLLGEVF